VVLSLSGGGELRRSGAVIVLLGVLVSSAIASNGADASGAELRGPVVRPFSTGVGINPWRLPEGRFAPARLTLRQWIAEPDGSHPPALKGELLELDRNLRIDARGVPTCDSGGRLAVARGPEEFGEVCGDAQVGRGSIRVEVQFADQPPLKVRSRFRIGNGGYRKGVLTLYIYSYLPAPITRSVVVTAKVDRGGRGRYRHRMHLRVPRIASGAGSIERFDLILGRRILSAACPDGLLTVLTDATFYDATGRTNGEAHTCRRKRTSKRHSTHRRWDLPSLFAWGARRAS